MKCKFDKACKAPTIGGLIYCRVHLEIAKQMPLAEKIEQQRKAGWLKEKPLPGFEAAIEEGKSVVAADKQLALTEILASPKADIEAKAGLIETNSPLFRGHGPQGELF